MPDDSTAASERLLGRDDELDRLRRHLPDVGQGRGSLYLLEGDPGIGKTTLAEAFCDEAAQIGAQALWGRCWEGGGAPPFWPWVQVLRTALTPAEAAPALAALGPRARYVAALVPELAPDEAGDREAVASDEARFALFDAVTRLLQHIAERRPVALVLDDLHAADIPSLLLLRFVTRELRAIRAVVVGTYRPTEAQQRADVAQALADVAREGTVLSLSGLERGSLECLVERMTGLRPSRRLVEAVSAASDGNPFFAQEVVRLLRAEGRLEIDALPHGIALPVPNTVRETLRQRLDPIPSPLRNVLDVAAVIGRSFPLELLSHVSGQGTDELLALLDVATREHLVEPGSSGTFQFVHALVRETLYQALPMDVRADLHLRVAESMERLYESDLTPHLGTLAHHYARAWRHDSGRRALTYALRAAEQALSVLAYEDAIADFQQARQLAAQAEAGPDERYRILLGLGRARLKSGDIAGGREDLAAAAEVARSLDAGRFAAAALAYGDTPVEGGLVNEVLVSLLEDALQQLDSGDSDLRARLLARLAMELYFSTEAKRRKDLAQEALAMARRLGSPHTLATVVRPLCTALYGPDAREQGLQLANELLLLGRQLRDPEIQAQARARRTNFLVERGLSAEFHADVEALAQLAADLRQPQIRWYAITLEVVRAWIRGDLAAAERFVNEAVELAGNVPNGMGAYIAQIVALRVLTGGSEQFEETVRTVGDTRPGVRHVWRSALASVHAASGSHDLARDELVQLAAELPRFQRDGQWIAAQAWMCETLRLVREPSVAAVLLEHLAPHADLHAFVSMGLPTMYLDPVSYHVGVAAAVAGRYEDAEKYFERAWEMAASFGAAGSLAKVQVEYGRMLLERGDPGDHGRALTLLRRGADGCEKAGMAPMAAEAQALLSEAAQLRVATAFGTTDASGAGKPTREASLRREGDYWVVERGEARALLKDSKGVRYLAALLASPGREVHVLDLVAVVEGARAPQRRSGDAQLRPADGDAGAVLDPQAKAAYRARIEDLRADIDEAESFNDVERAARAREELDFLTSELAGALGLGGRDRKMDSPGEQARSSVTKVIRRTLDKIEQADPELGRHLRATIRTGTFCGYLGELEALLSWRIDAPQRAEA